MLHVFANLTFLSPCMGFIRELKLATGVHPQPSNPAWGSSHGPARERPKLKHSVLYHLAPSSSSCSRSSELFRQEFSVDSFLQPPTVFHTTLVGDPADTFRGGFRLANARKQVCSS